VIPIIISYMINGTVEVTIPDWGEEGIVPKPM